MQIIVSNLGPHICRVLQRTRPHQEYIGDLHTTVWTHTHTHTHTCTHTHTHTHTNTHTSITAHASTLETQTSTVLTGIITHRHRHADTGTETCLCDLGKAKPTQSDTQRDTDVQPCKHVYMPYMCPPTLQSIIPYAETDALPHLLWKVKNVLKALMKYKLKGEKFTIYTENHGCESRTHNSQLRKYRVTSTL